MDLRVHKMRELPFELVTEILARVPINDLRRFRLVCKSWCSLFQDERFIRTQTTHAPTMLLLRHSPKDPLSACTYQGRRLEMMKFEEPELNNGGEEESLLLQTIVLGHYNGLFCLHLRGGSLVVWNPTLRELRKVSIIKPVQARSMIGFGYDHSIQDHKIVLIPSLRTSKYPFYEAQVLTLKSSVPRRIGFPLKENCDWFCWRNEGIVVGENIFWQLYSRKPIKETNKSILTFNVVSETFNYCSSPGLRRGKQVYRNLHLLRASLYAEETDCGDMVVWCADLDKEDKGRIKSWSKILRLTASDIERSTCWLVDDFWVGTVINHTGLLLVKVRTREGEMKICEYTLEKDTLRKVETSSLPIGFNLFGRMEEYLATLVPTRASSI